MINQSVPAVGTIKDHVGKAVERNQGTGWMLLVMFLLSQFLFLLRSFQCHLVIPYFNLLVLSSFLATCSQEPAEFIGNRNEGCRYGSLLHHFTTEHMHKNQDLKGEIEPPLLIISYCDNIYIHHVV